MILGYLTDIEIRLILQLTQQVYGMKEPQPLKILITGASSGIGEALAYKFAQQGHVLFLVARRQEKLEKLASQIKTPVHIYPLDIRDQEKVKTSLQSLEIDVLINNAGIALGRSPFQETSSQDINQVIETNINGLVNCTHALLPPMVHRNKGHIINIGSIAGKYPYLGSHVYGASKAFVEQFSFNLRADLLGTALKVTCIAPGLTKTDFFDVRFKGDKDKVKDVYQNIMALQAQDIAETVDFCVHLPAHVNINFMEVMSVYQAFSNIAMHHFKE